MRIRNFTLPEHFPHGVLFVDILAHAGEKEEINKITICAAIKTSDGGEVILALEPTRGPEVGVTPQSMRVRTIETLLASAERNCGVQIAGKFDDNTPPTWIPTEVNIVNLGAFHKFVSSLHKDGQNSNSPRPSLHKVW